VNARGLAKLIEDGRKHRLKISGGRNTERLFRSRCNRKAEKRPEKQQKKPREIFPHAHG
jgi:hypothetical protein